MWSQLFCFFNFVKNAQLCHFLRGLCIFFTFSICQKWPILSFWKSGLQIMNISMISLHHMWAIRLFCQKCSILSFSERPVNFFTFNIVTKGPFCHFGKVEFKLWDIVLVQYVISIILLLQFCQKCSILSSTRGLFSTVDFCEQDPFYFIFEMNFCNDVKNLWKTSSVIVFKVATSFSIRSWNNILLYENFFLNILTKKPWYVNKELFKKRWIGKKTFLDPRKKSPLYLDMYPIIFR